MSEVIFTYEGGWGCSNDATYTAEVELIREPEGKMFSRHTSVVRAMDYFIQGKRFEKGQKAEVAYKNEEGVKTGYSAEITGLTEEMVILAVSGHIEVKRIVSTIKEQNHGK